MKRPTLWAIAVCGLLGLQRSASADLVVTVLDTTMAENAASKYVDVTIYSTTGTDLLANYQYVFQITRHAANPDLGGIEFDAANNVYNNAYQNEPPGYIFAASNTSYVTGTPVGTTGDGPNPPNDQFLSSDFSVDPNTFDYVNVQVGDISHPALLARLLLVPETGSNAPHAGDKFDITLMTTDPFTVFQYADSGNNLTDVGASGVTGTVTIVGAVHPVPEPAAISLLGSGTAVLALGCFLRRRRTV